MELQKKPTAEDEEQVVYLNVSDAQTQNNPAVSKISNPELKFAQIRSNIVNGKMFLDCHMVEIKHYKSLS